MYEEKWKEHQASVGQRVLKVPLGKDLRVGRTSNAGLSCDRLRCDVEVDRVDAWPAKEVSSVAS